MTDLAELLSRVCAATGPDRELDEALCVALLDSRLPVAVRRLSKASAYTASVDAALALVERVLPGWTWNVASARERAASTDDPRPQGGVTNPAGRSWRTGGATPALAILAALLKAMIVDHGAAPAPPWPIGAANSKRHGWESFFSGKGREACPFPRGRRDLQESYREGWDAAKIKSEGGAA